MGNDYTKLTGTCYILFLFSFPNGRGISIFLDSEFFVSFIILPVLLLLLLLFIARAFRLRKGHGKDTRAGTTTRGESG